MSTIVDEDFKRWTAKRKAALVMDIIQGKTSISEASRSFAESYSGLGGNAEGSLPSNRKHLYPNPFNIAHHCICLCPTTFDHNLRQASSLNQHILR